MTAMRSDMVSASSWSCVTKTAVVPSSRSRRRSSICMVSRSLRSSAEKGGLDAARGPEQRDELAGTHLEIDAAQHGGGTERFLRRGNVEKGVRHGAPYSAMSRSQRLTQASRLAATKAQSTVWIVAFV